MCRSEYSETVHYSIAGMRPGRYAQDCKWVAKVTRCCTEFKLSSTHPLLLFGPRHLPFWLSPASRVLKRWYLSDEMRIFFLSGGWSVRALILVTKIIWQNNNGVLKEVIGMVFKYWQKRRKGERNNGKGRKREREMQSLLNGEDNF